MAYMLDYNAVNRWLSDPEGGADPFPLWLTNNRVAPHIVPTTLTRLANHYRLPSTFNEPEDREMMISRLLRPANQIDDTSVQSGAWPVRIDTRLSILCGRISASQIARNHPLIDTFELAGAINGGHRLLVGGPFEPIKEIADNLPARLGILNVFSADTPPE